MGIMYHPIAKGQIDGHREGLESDLPLFEFAHNLEFENFGSDYWIGFGAGYAEGQKIRTQMKNIDNRLLLEEKIACCQYLFLKQRACQTNPQDYLDNIQRWDNLKIDSNVTQTALKLLEKKRIQGAMHIMFLFYKDNFRLKALKEIEILLSRLKDTRNEKRKYSSYDTSKDRLKIESDLKSWLCS